MSPKSARVDVGLVIAIKEEMDTLLMALNANELVEAEKIEGMDAYHLHFDDGNEEAPSIIAVLQDDMGEIHAMSAAKNLINAFHPRLIVSLGISGSLARDVLIGDIVLTSEVEDYLHRGKASDDLPNANYQIHFGGKPAFFELDLTRRLSRVEYSHGRAHELWQYENYLARRKRLGEEELDSLVARDVVRVSPKIHSGPSACGPVVVSSQFFIDTLLSHNRNFLSVDMESYAVARAAMEAHTPAICIRGISDLADSQKAKVDQAYKNNLRAVAIYSAATFLRHFIREVGEYIGGSVLTDSGLSKWPDLQSGLVEMTQRYLGRDPKGNSHIRRTPVVPHHSDLTAGTPTRTRDRQLQQLLRLINPADPDKHVSIQGGLGVGKSYLLRRTHRHLLLEYQKNPNSPFPVYIDLKYYDRLLLQSEQGAHIARSAFRDDIRILKRALAVSDRPRLVIMIDSIDLDAKHRASLEDISSESIKHGEDIVVIVGLGLSQRNEDRVLYWTSVPSLALTLTSMDSLSAEADELIKDVVEEYTPGKDENVETLKKIIHTFDVREVDYLTLALLVQRIDSNVLNNSSSISDLYRAVCEEYVRNNAAQLKGQTLSDVAEKAHQLFIQLKPIDHGENGGESIWKLLYYHPSIQDFMVAYHVIDVFAQIGHGHMERHSVINNVYPERIDRLCKGVMLHSQVTEVECVDGAEKLYELFESDPETYISGMTQGAYLLGRVQSAVPRNRAKQLLLRWKDAYFDWDANEKEQFSVIAIEVRLLYIRTLFISLAYLGVQKATEDYVGHLLTDARWDNLNRGFHLEYYHDILYLPTDRQLAHEDDLRPFPRTFAALTRRVEAYIRGQENPIVEIELFTLLSLGQHRHAVGRLPDQYRERLKDLIHGIRSRERASGRKMLTVLRDYTDMMEETLREGFAPGQVIEKICGLKSTKRKGWTHRGIDDGETVADHTLGALLIAEVFLPEKYEGFEWSERYDKQDILRMLLTHDIAEAYTGDMLPAEHRAELEEPVVRFLESSGTYRDLCGLAGILRRWEEFEFQKTINGRIARDIDVIDMLMQLFVYVKRDGRAIAEWEKMRRELIAEVRTEPGSKLVEVISRAFGVVNS